MPQASKYASAAKTIYLAPPVHARPSRKHLSILSGFSGLCGGTLLSSAAFISFHGAASTTVWTIMLDNDTSLQKGDSGSWAVDDEGRLVGTVIAISGGDAYIIPAYDHLQRIRCHFSNPVQPLIVPSPLQCYLELAGDSDKSNPHRAYQFAAKALTRDVLLASSLHVDLSSMDRVALAVALATTMFPVHRHYEHGLKQLLCTLGSKLPIRLELGLTPSEALTATPYETLAFRIQG